MTADAPALSFPALASSHLVSAIARLAPAGSTPWRSFCQANGLQIDDFLFRLEHLQNMYGCSWNDVLRDFHLMVEEEAKSWYWVFLAASAKAGNDEMD